MDVTDEGIECQRCKLWFHFGPCSEVDELEDYRKEYKNKKYKCTECEKIIFITYISGFLKLIFPIGIIECRNYTLGVFCARGEAEGCKTHRGFNFYSIL